MTDRFLILFSLILGGLFSTSLTAQNAPPQMLLFINVNIFDGFEENVKEGMSVLIEDNYIKTIAETIDSPEATVIDGEGKTMTPGLIDMHSHIMLNLPGGTASFQTRFDEAAAGAKAQHHLMHDYLYRGFTTIRDIAGDSLDIAKASKEGIIPGPRIYSSGGAIGPTGGHSDFIPRNIDPTQFRNDQDFTQASQNTWVVDGLDEAAFATRMNLRRGAAFIKIMAGGGVASEFDPLDAQGLAVDELNKVVEIARDNGTYVAQHGYTDAQVNRALDAGVRSIEHAALITENTAERMSEMEDVVFSYQCFMGTKTFATRSDLPPWMSEDQKDKAMRLATGYNALPAMMRKHNVFTIGGADMYNVGLMDRVKEDITCHTDKGYTPAEALKHFTGNAGIVLSWSDIKDPYRQYGKGAIKENYYADILLWDGDPTKDINLILDEDKLHLVMKGGVIFKNIGVSTSDPGYVPVPKIPSYLK